MSSNKVEIIDQIIQDRRTVKVLAPEALPATDIKQTVEELVSVAGWAPFHYPSQERHHLDLESPVPWRFYMLDAPACRQLAAQLADKHYGKIVEMLNSAEALIQTTWLPTQVKEDCKELYEPSLANMENIAAASAAVQNILLAATARGIPNYWSSGGILREDDLFIRMQISPSEILLGSIFLFPNEGETPDNVQHAYSKRRDTRGDAESWSRWVTLC